MPTVAMDLPTSRFDAARTIFFFVAASDETVAPEELEVLAQFYVAQGRTIEDLGEDLTRMRRAYSGATPLEVFGAIAHAAELIKERCEPAERQAVLEVAILASLADGILAPAERAVVTLLADLWALDPEAVVREAISRSARDA